MSVKVGSFVKSTTTGAQSVTGVGFQPKALLVWTTRQASAGQTDVAFLSFGFSDGINDRCSSHHWRDSSGITTDASESHTDAALLRLISNGVGSTSVDAECTLSSFGADGFTVNWSVNDAVASIVHYMAIGGVAQAFAGSFNSPASGNEGNQSITGVGFEPAFVLFLSPDRDIESDSDATAERSVITLGAMDANGGQWASSVVVTGQGARSWQSASQCLAIVDGDGSVDELATFVSMDADGFTHNWSVVSGSPNVVFFLALGNVSAKVGSFLQPTATGAQGVSGIGFTPDAVMLVSQCKTTAIEDDGGRMSIGAGDGSSQGCAWIGMPYPGSNVPSARSSQTTNAIRLLTPHATGSSSPINAEASLTALTFGEMSLDWTTVDSTARQILYLALKSAETEEEEEEEEGGVIVEVGDPPVEVNPLRWSFNMQATANGIDTMSCEIESDLTVSPVQRFSIFDPITVRLNGETIFGGRIERAHDDDTTD